MLRGVFASSTDAGPDVPTEVTVQIDLTASLTCYAKYVPCVSPDGPYVRADLQVRLDHFLAEANAILGQLATKHGLSGCVLETAEEVILTTPEGGTVHLRPGAPRRRSSGRLSPSVGPRRATGQRLRLGHTAAHPLLADGEARPGGEGLHSRDVDAAPPGPVAREATRRL